jgi:hypothetical protein
MKECSGVCVVFQSLLRWTLDERVGVVLLRAVGDPGGSPPADDQSRKPTLGTHRGEVLAELRAKIVQRSHEGFLETTFPVVTTLVPFAPWDGLSAECERGQPASVHKPVCGATG